MDHVRVVFRWLRDMLRGAWGVLRAISPGQRDRVPGDARIPLEAVRDIWQRDRQRSNRHVDRALQGLAERQHQDTIPALLLMVDEERRLYLVKDSLLARTLCASVLGQHECGVVRVGWGHYCYTDLLIITDPEVIERLLPLIEEYGRSRETRVEELRSWQK